MREKRKTGAYLGRWQKRKKKDVLYFLCIRINRKRELGRGDEGR